MSSVRCPEEEINAQAKGQSVTEADKVEKDDGKSNKQLLISNTNNPEVDDSVIDANDPKKTTNVTTTDQ